MTLGPHGGLRDGGWQETPKDATNCIRVAHEGAVGATISCLTMLHLHQSDRG